MAAAALLKHQLLLLAAIFAGAPPCAPDPAPLVPARARLDHAHDRLAELRASEAQLASGLEAARAAADNAAAEERGLSAGVEELARRTVRVCVDGAQWQAGMPRGMAVHGV